MTKPFVFSFDVNDVEEVYSFPVTYPDGSNEDDIGEAIVDACEQHEMEAYGVHNVCHDSEELFGFNTYEVSPDNILEVMNKWKDILTNDFGFACGDISKQ